MCNITMIKIRLGDLEKIFHHCREELPIEACGILAGKIKDDKEVTVKEVLRVYNCRNELNSPTEYKVGVEELFKILSEINDMSLRLLGFYHGEDTYALIDFADGATLYKTGIPVRESEVKDEGLIDDYEIERFLVSRFKNITVRSMGAFSRG